MVIKLWFVFLIIPFITSCAGTGLFYTNVVKPYSNDFENTPIGSKSFQINTHRFREPVSRLRVSGEWDTDEIMNAARNAGMKEIHHIDLLTF